MGSESPGSRRTSGYQRSGSDGSGISLPKGPTSPALSVKTPFLPPPVTNGSTKNIEEMTRMLDEMITGRVEKTARRSSLRPVTEGP